MWLSFEHCGSCYSSRQTWPPRLVAMHNCMHLSSQQTRYLEHSHKPKTQWAEERRNEEAYFFAGAAHKIFVRTLYQCTQGAVYRQKADPVHAWPGLGCTLAGPTRNKLLFGPAQYYFTKDQATWLLFFWIGHYAPNYFLYYFNTIIS